MSLTAATAPEDASDAVLRSDSDAIATLTLNKPNSLNALSDEVLDVLQAELDAISVDGNIRAVILRGAGRAFCTGHNLKDMRSNYTLAYQEALFAKCSRMMLSVHRLPQPVIAQVHGLATAAGCQLVATCDLAVAAHDARFATSGINAGLFCSTPGVALGRNVNRKQSMQMLLTGDFIDADKAREIGLINEVAPADALEATTRALAATLTAKSAFSLTLGKQAFYRQLEMGISDAYEFAAAEMARNFMDRDAAEGVDAFIAKRDPVWDQSRRDDDND